MKKSYLIDLAIILLALSASFYIRGIMPQDSVFRNGMITFSMDDGIYQMRVVENLVANFPQKIWFDPFTQFPNGQYLHFGVLWTYVIAIVAIMLGMGNPSVELVRTVGAYMPAVFGSLMVIPAYVIGKELFGRRVGIVSALLMVVMPGQILQRATLGFTDHHIGEVLLSSVFLMFVVMAVKRGSIKYAVLAGIGLDLYIYQWVYGIYFAGVVAIYFALDISVRHLRGMEVEKITKVGIVTFVSAIPLMFLVIDPSNGFRYAMYSYLDILVMIVPAVGIWLLGNMSMQITKMGLPKLYYLGGLGVVIIIGNVLMNSVELFASAKMFFSILNPLTHGGTTIAEAMKPERGNILSDFPSVGIWFLSNYYIAIAGMIIGGVMVVRKWESEKVAFLVWAIVVYTLSQAQIRWFYYHSFPVTIFVSFVAVGLVDIVGLRVICEKYIGKVVEMGKGKHKKSEFKKMSLEEVLKSSKAQIMAIIVAVWVVWIVVFSPNYTVAMGSTRGGVAGADWESWFESLNWMRYNTPETGLDFNGSYVRPPNGKKYQYPDSAYGVMSWWDYGHLITYFAHRIPNANPFQAGIGGGTDHKPGASTFLIADTEEKATGVLKELGVDGKLGAKYVVTNSYMAYSILPVFAEWDYSNTGYMQRLRTNNGDVVIPSKKYFDTMSSKLHIFDGNGLKQYRLVHESLPNPYTRGSNEEKPTKYVYNQLFSGGKVIPEEMTAFVKIFEIVKGARIVGYAPAGSTVSISNTVITNVGRSVKYEQSIVADEIHGGFELIVPYSTPMCSGDGIGGGCSWEWIETKFDTKVVGQYVLSYGNVSKSIEVSEKAILDGMEIMV